MFKDCSVLQASFKGVLRMFRGYPKEVSWMFQESFKRSATIKTQYLYFYSMYIVVLWFLAAMSSSRSDDVTQFVRLSVRTQGDSYKPKNDL